jgi:hypothetical protein
MYANGGKMMNRIEIVGLFTALEQLCAKDDIASIKKIVEAVLDEARTEKKDEVKHKL